uniref:Uncharacterized protein n=1 Tax=Moniliophthora roreri TaxID=221103 RepID=A0A0W0FNT6_MONRR
MNEDPLSASIAFSGLRYPRIPGFTSVLSQSHSCSLDAVNYVFDTNTCIGGISVSMIGMN